MNLNMTAVHILDHTAELSNHGKTGVSLHCHSMYSKEMLDFLPHYAERMPIISFFYKKEKERYLDREGAGINFSTAFWSPPMTPQAVYDSEKKQFADAGLAAMISITDHDEIGGAFEILDTEKTEIPVSLEWTVPFEIGFFHLGVHNLPRDRAAAITKDLLAYTDDPKGNSVESLNVLLDMLCELPGVLVVLNHPIGDIELIGSEAHMLLLERFIAKHGRWIHALEVNGFRSWSENKAVLELAESLDMPVVSGGDRHGCQANTVVNVTDACEYAEFVAEVRNDRRSQIAVLPEYKRPLPSKQMRSFSEILGRYPEFPVERQRWFDRVHFDIGNGKGIVPLSAHGWKNGGPVWLRLAIKTLGLMGSDALVPAFRLIRKRADRVPESFSMNETTRSVPAGKLRSEAA